MAQFIPMGDTSFLVRFGDTISDEVNRKVQAFAKLIEEERIAGIVELVPTYCDVVVYYDALEIPYKRLMTKMEELSVLVDTKDLPLGNHYKVPVCYGDAYGMDINEVAFQNGLSLHDVVKLHTETELRVYMLGFTPGFCYLGGMNEKLTTSRKRVPKETIKAGSVGIAGSQTGIYPVDSPGGWQIIGRSPIRLFNPKNDPPFLFKAGDYIQFYSIDKQEFMEIELQVQAGSFKIESL